MKSRPHLNVGKIGDRDRDYLRLLAVSAVLAAESLTLLTKALKAPASAPSAPPESQPGRTPGFSGQ